MCGIVAAIAERNVTPILLEGLRRLEYRGYDSAGIAVLNDTAQVERARAAGKVALLEALLEAEPLVGLIGVAHTRWATHGEPSERNAHPHISEDAALALVHNGIIENHEVLRQAQQQAGYSFTSDTDTEVIVHAIDAKLAAGLALFEAVKATLSELQGAFALGVIHQSEPNRLIVARRGSPLVIGVGIGEHFVASDVFALLPVTQRFIFLEDGDMAELTREGVKIFDRDGVAVARPEVESSLSADAADKGHYRHYMLKEIFEQPRAIADTLEGRLGHETVLPESLGHGAQDILQKIQAVQIVACGTSFHAGMVARYWIESMTGLPCRIEVASEFRYRPHIVSSNTLFVTISQSGETADTLAALQLAKELGFAKTLCICNVAESSLTRESDMTLLTHAGPEIGVASTKAFTTQLVALLLMVCTLSDYHCRDKKLGAKRIELLRSLPKLVDRVLALDDEIKALALAFSDKQHALFLGRGEQYPIAMEGALKLKEISYIHAEAYPAGELKHGPLALIDEKMPVVAVAPDNALLEKLKSNLEEVRARGGQLFVFADERVAMQSSDGVTVIRVPATDDLLAPIVFSIPLQLLAYHVAILKGTDVDQPRNLAKSVTVE